MLALSVLLLVAGLGSGFLGMLLWGALAMHPAPSQSGYVPPTIFCICASLICLVLAFIAGLVAVLF
ncbi:hypothetical protein ASD44_09760 [Mesorhizobium sp. Root554]|uniref:hypothetical protein n=1 Tax=unclassified Mesorhizobium TaxID=325217 RepID=UPI0007019A85|nr:MULTISPECIES: hypothetical protein [unclassified Mesorhizobium]KQZ14328.1 hypothetical protein ASD27_09770 [Mesorhizobium sp. Root1471]KQZ36839.1 hypothetical protein ASD44_09760 [Mesorhizobium sp. Root554]